MVEFAIKLILAHVVGDFILQPKNWVEDKLKNKYKSKYLYYHIVVHAILLLFAFQLEVKYWLGYLFIVFTHLIIDILKLNSNNQKYGRALFFIDQFAHLLVILLVVLFYNGEDFDLSNLFSTKIQLFLIAIFLVTKTVSIFIDVIISKWKTKETGLSDAGSYIGMLERLLIFFFIIVGHWEGVGFLLAAKSIFRFSDLTRAEDRNLTEYILIGTLLSFGFAMIIGKLYLVTNNIL